MGNTSKTHVVALENAEAVISIFQKIDSRSREIVSKNTDQIEINGQTAPFMVVDLWGRRVTAEELLKALRNSEVVEPRLFETGVATLRSSLQEILVGYLTLGAKLGIAAELSADSAKITELLQRDGWPSDRSILDYLRSA